jgi:Flp pilus assembly protein TadD
MNRLFLPIALSAALLATAIPFTSHATQESGPSKAAIAAGDAYLRALAAAGDAYSQRDFAKALEKLDIADQIAPNIPDTWSMRGAIYAEQHAYEKAEDAFEKEGKLLPGDFWPQYNAAELLLMEKKYAQAAAEFQGLVVYAGHEELVEFKVVYADLLQGNASAAKPVLDSMKFPSDSPAYYFAQAAWAFAHQDEKHGTYWVDAGLKVFGLQKCLAFYDALARAKWVAMRNADGSVPASEQLPISLDGGRASDLSAPEAGATP